MKTIHLLVTTMNGRIKPTLEKFSQYLEAGVEVHIAHQITDGSKPIELSVPGISYYYSMESGLSKNRNLLLEHIVDGIGLICDDDIVLVPGRYHRIMETIAIVPNAAVWTTRTITPQGELRKRYAKAAFRHNKLTILSVSSIEMVIDLQKIDAYGRRFDEDRGLGTDRPGGEEQIFLDNVLQDKQQVVSIPLVLTIHPKESSNTGIPRRHKVELMEELFGRGIGTVLGILLYSYLFLIYLAKQLNRHLMR